MGRTFPGSLIKGILSFASQLFEVAEPFGASVSLMSVSGYFIISFEEFFMFNENMYALYGLLPDLGLHCLSKFYFLDTMH